MKQFSYSRVECFKKCPFQFGLRYLQGMTTLKNQDPNNALYLGNAIHTGLETSSVENAINEYKLHYYQLNDLHINEIIKLEHMLQKTIDMLDRLKSIGYNDDCEFIHEYEINQPKYKGFVDLIVKKPDGTVDIYDYKYSNNVDSYMESGQLHVYKYYLEQEGFNVGDMGYIFIPKVQIRQKKTEDLYQFRQRLKAELEEKEPFIEWVEYDYNKVIKFIDSIVDIFQEEDFNKNITKLCDWCEYKNFCQNGDTSEMNLPKNERRTIEKVSKKVMWLYGSPYSGKTTLANQFPDPLMLNTDGNIKFVDAPYIAIKNVVEMDGRIKREQLAWEVFKEAVDELEKKQNTFKTLVVDLLEDIYEHCRIWGCRELGIDHESDNSFKAYDYVRSEFLRTMNRLCNLDYENIILISHEDISKDIMKKSGDKITRIAPNIPEKIANKIGGMVDFTARVVAEGDDRKLILKASDVVFGGGRLTDIKVDTVPLNYDAVMSVYDAVSTKNKKVEQVQAEEEKTQSEANVSEQQEVVEEEQKPTRARRSRKAE